MSEKISYSAASDALDDIVGKLGAGNVPLEDALSLFETGIAHLKVCQQALNTAEGKLQVLLQDDSLKLDLPDAVEEELEPEEED